MKEKEVYKVIYIILIMALLNISGIIFFRNNKKILIALLIMPILVLGIVVIAVTVT